VTWWTVVIGVGTHKQWHVAVGLDELGRVIDSQTVAATNAGSGRFRSNRPRRVLHLASLFLALAAFAVAWFSVYVTALRNARIEVDLALAAMEHGSGVIGSPIATTSTFSVTLFATNEGSSAGLLESNTGFGAAGQRGLVGKPRDVGGTRGVSRRHRGLQVKDLQVVVRVPNPGQRIDALICGAWLV
jgi:hypothetical protein